MHVKLKVLRGASAGKEIAVKTLQFVIGRAEECSLRVNSEAISRQHCVISFDGHEVRIRDLGSRNGTFVNGERLEAPRRLVMGDQLRVGPMEFLVTHAFVPQASTGVVAESRSPLSAEQDMAGRISDWLTEAEDTDRRVDSVEIETRVFRMDDTGRIPVAPADSRKAAAGDGSTDSQGAADSQDSSDSQGTTEGTEGTENAAPAAFGKKTPPKNVAPKDTQEAAAQTLRKLLNRGTS